ncbi:prolipoprotein diacylglyceryl transferase [Candidatus Daviesbacteria bacterium]|nr:prolipoprotein diacylglyceryl transferase [Candidatus Daviesbacteria bacterium]
MLPVLFSIGNISVSSFGVFLGMGFLAGGFLIWRLSRAWDLDEEKILDLSLLTFLTGLIGARIYFVLENWAYFSDSFLKIILFTKYPGFSFWGAFLGGFLGLAYFTRRLRQGFWQFADIFSVGFLAGVIFGNVGCFLGGCNAGAISNFLSVPLVGMVGRRFPVQILESMLLFLVLIKLWSQATHFHQRGKIISLSLIYLGAVQLITQPLKASHEDFPFSLVLIILGVTIFYRITKGNPILDVQLFVKFIKGLFFDPQYRRMYFLKLSKDWYNQKVAFLWHLRNLNKLVRRLNVKFSRKDPKFN